MHKKCIICEWQLFHWTMREVTLYDIMRRQSRTGFGNKSRGTHKLRKLVILAIKSYEIVGSFCGIMVTVVKIDTATRVLILKKTVCIFYTVLISLRKVRLQFFSIYLCTKCRANWQHESGIVTSTRRKLWWFGLVSLFNGISTFLGYLMPKPFSSKTLNSNQFIFA